MCIALKLICQVHQLFCIVEKSYIHKRTTEQELDQQALETFYIFKFDGIDTKTMGYLCAYADAANVNQ